MPPTWRRRLYRVIMQHNMTTISILAVDVNRHFHYSRYFDMIPVGPEGTRAFSKGFFALAAAQKTEAANRCDRIRRRRIFENLRRRSAGERQCRGLQDHL